MRNIFLLTKNYILCGIGSLRGKKSKLKSSLSGICLILALFAGIFALLLYTQIQQISSIAEMVEEGVIGQALLDLAKKQVLGSGFLMGIFLAMVLSFQKVTGGQRANDTELLLAMPFKKSEIMIAKALSRYLFNLLVVLLLVVPSIIAYMIYTPFALVTFLGNLITLLMIPLLAVGVSYFVDFITAFCFPNSKFGNVAKAIFTLIILVLGLYVYEYISISSSNIDNIESSVLNKIIDYIITFNPLFMFALIAIALAVFFLGVWVFSITINHETKSTKSKAVVLAAKPTTPFKSLLKNEVNRYLNSTVLMINTLIGPIGIVAVTIWLLVDKCQTITSLGAMMGMTANFSYVLVALVYGFFVIMTYPAAFSISLEGKQLWILKTMPIKVRTVFWVKALFNVLLITPVLVLCAILLGIVLEIPFAFTLYIIMLPVVINLLVSFGGLFTNLLFPKFEFESEAAVVKQSVSSVIMMLVGMIVEVILFVLFFNLLDTALSMTMILLIPLLTLFGLALIFIVLTFTVGTRIFNKF